MVEQTCAKCTELKPIQEFPVAKYVSWCKACYMDDHQRRRSALLFELDGVMRSGLQLRRKYKMSIEAYIALYTAQDGHCAICLTKPEDRILVVDHNHETSAVRELLCSFCNWTIGHAKENPETLRLAAEYLEKHNV